MNLQFIKPIILLSVLCITSCNTNNQNESVKDKKIIDFNIFSIAVPEDWDKVNLQGIDSYTGGITDGTDTLYFDYGENATKFEEDVRIYPLSEKGYFSE